MSPIISVIVPFLNHRDLIKRAVEKMLEQTFTPWELLLVDNNSADGSAQIAHEMQQRHPDRVRVVHAPRQGIPQARNRGLEEARGEFVSFLDVDDHFTPTKLADHVAILQKHPETAMVYGLTRRIYLPEGREVIQDTGIAVEGLNPPPELAIDWLRSLYRLPQTGATLVRTRIARAVGGFEESLMLGNDDVAYHLKLAFNYPVWFLNKEAVVYYRHHSSAGAALNREKSVNRRYFDAYAWAARYAADYECRTGDGRARRLAEQQMAGNLGEMVAALRGTERRELLRQFLQQEQAAGFLTAPLHRWTLALHGWLPRRLAKKCAGVAYRCFARVPAGNTNFSLGRAAALH